MVPPMNAPPATCTSDATGGSLSSIFTKATASAMTFPFAPVVERVIVFVCAASKR